MAVDTAKVLRMPDSFHGRDRTSSNWLTTTCANRGLQLEVVLITIILALVLMTITVSEIFAAKVTLEVLWMHTLAKEKDILSGDRFLALGANVDGRIDHNLHLLFTFCAVWLTASFFECSPGEDQSTTLASEVVRMVDSSKRFDDAFPHRLLTGVATWRIELPIVCLAVRLALVLYKLAAREWLRAVRAYEMLRMVGFVHGVCHLANDHLAALSARWPVKSDGTAIRCVSGHS